jgi:hypothetical protein
MSFKRFVLFMSSRKDIIAADFELNESRELIHAMHRAYQEGRNAMEEARRILGTDNLPPLAILVAYDLQAGSYVDMVRKDFSKARKWHRQLGNIIQDEITKAALSNKTALNEPCSIMEIGCGEATTLEGVLHTVDIPLGPAYGLDLSWSRINAGREWLKEHSVAADLFVGDISGIPMFDNSVDVVFSCHSLEPNRGREFELISECVRVARNLVILFEPLYELASREARTRMDEHGYVQGLREAAEKCAVEIKAFKLLDFVLNPLNPTGVIVLSKADSWSASDKTADDDLLPWMCPLSNSRLLPKGDYYSASGTGLVYPVLKEIPMLRKEHVMVASGLA